MKIQRRILRIEVEIEGKDIKFEMTFIFFFSEACLQRETIRQIWISNTE